MTATNPTNQPRKQRNTTTAAATEELTVALHIETTDERPPDWESIWRELLLKPRGSAVASPQPDESIHADESVAESAGTMP